MIIQKHTAEIAESGVMIYFSFLLLDIKFIIVLNERYTAMMIQIIFVAFSENQNGISPPIVNSPNGKPQTIRNDNTITIEKTPAPIIATIVNLQIPIFRSI